MGLVGITAGWTGGWGWWESQLGGLVGGASGNHSWVDWWVGLVEITAGWTGGASGRQRKKKSDRKAHYLRVTNNTT